jgi:RNA polymerase sigma-70 factor, ECF subfamily
MASDQDLFLAIAGHDGKSFELLFERNYSKLCRFACHYTGMRELAEEVVADVFVRLWESRERLSGIDNARAYLYQSVKNASLNAMKARPHDTVKIEEEPAALLRTDVPADASVIYSETVMHVERAISLMPSQRQIIFRLSRFDGLTYKEIAEVLSISIHTVQNQMVLAVKFLHQVRAKLNLHD